MVNLNDMAKRITLKEGKKRQVSIAQVKEVMKLTFEELAELEIEEITKIINRYK